MILKLFIYFVNNFILTEGITMSEQQGGLLQANSSYHFNRQSTNNYKAEHIDSNKFFAWQKDHMYKSSYAHHHSPDSVNPKNTITPGYLGFVPSRRADSLYGKNNTMIAKETFNRDRLDVNRTGLATTGFNITKEALIDKSKLASSSKYGKTEIQYAHPNWSEKWQTSNQITYKDPKDVKNPMFREGNAVVDKHHNKTSGFSQNHAYLDGTGWNPHPILTANNISSEYRNRFNPEMQFHRKVDQVKQKKLPHKDMNYHYNY